MPCQYIYACSLVTKKGLCTQGLAYEAECCFLNWYYIEELCTHGQGICAVFIALCKANHVLASVCMAGDLLATLGNHLASFPCRLLCQCPEKLALKQSVYTYWMHWWTKHFLEKKCWNCKLLQVVLICLKRDVYICLFVRENAHWLQFQIIANNGKSSVNTLVLSLGHFEL